MQPDKILASVTQTLPEQFDFYTHGNVVLGPIEKQPTSVFENDYTAYAFKFVNLEEFSEVLMVFAFEKSLDSSLYMEIGNIVVSKVASKLGRKKGLVSTPQLLDKKRIEQLISMDYPFLARNYFHSHSGERIPLKLLIFHVRGPHSTQETGNA